VLRGLATESGPATIVTTHGPEPDSASSASMGPLRRASLPAAPPSPLPPATPTAGNRPPAPCLMSGPSPPGRTSPDISTPQVLMYRKSSGAAGFPDVLHRAARDADELTARRRTHGAPANSRHAGELTTRRRTHHAPANSPRADELTARRRTHDAPAPAIAPGAAPARKAAATSGSRQASIAARRSPINREMNDRLCIVTKRNAVSSPARSR
jgi:hypothetical protein